jgi:hypothetical protein
MASHAQLLAAGFEAALTQKDGVLVWRVENFKPVRVPEVRSRE